MDNYVEEKHPHKAMRKAAFSLTLFACLLVVLLLASPHSSAQPITPGEDENLSSQSTVQADGRALAAAPATTPAPPPPPPPPGSGMTISQTLSDEGQRNTIAFDGLAFLTGSLGADSFFPPGKVADFWGFQYLRDNDPSGMGHNTDFLTRAALNMLHVLTPAQRTALIALAESQVDDINQYAYDRFVLMKAFRRLLEGDLPAGSTGLNLDAVKDYSAELYHLDGEISYQRAQVMGGMLHALDATQRAYLDAMVGQGMLTWPVVGEPPELQGLSHDVKVAVMTYAGDMLSWYAGSVEADVYFCPERQGTYFGSFYMKDAPAVGNPGYSIPVTMTGEMGEAFLQTLTADQAPLITNLVAEQKPALYEIVDRREDVATLLRQFMDGGVPDQTAVLDLMDRYGELDGEIVYRYATAFTQVSQRLTDEQQAEMDALRTQILGNLAFPAGAYLYSQPISMPAIPDTDFLFAAPLTVTLASFTAACQEGDPVITWETVSEVDTAGFNTWRSETASTPEIQLNASIIPAHPGSAQGYGYNWTDETAQPDHTYFYWLEDVAVSGESHLNGPIATACADPTPTPTNHQVYLPLVVTRRGTVNPPPPIGGGMTITQTLSDEGQRNTIAFDGLAFLTGNLGADSFFPPGKVADFWGFQYLRDNDPSGMGHNTDFLTRAALNMLHTLTHAQRLELIALAEGQVDDINQYAYDRFVLMKAFRRLLEGDLPAGTTGLNEDAVKAYAAELYRLDGEISLARAQLMGRLIASMDATQRATLDAMIGKGMLEWPDVAESSELQGLDRDVKEAVMTYAADLFSWYAGSLDADVYFCPERHGTYFGSFYLKDIPAMGNPGYAIPTDLTGNMGDAMLAVLTPDQAEVISGLVDIQKPYLLGIVDTREQVSIELRKFKAGQAADSASVLSLMEQYGELDGEIITNLAVNFAQVYQTLTGEQKAQLMALRNEMLGDLRVPTGAYLFSQPIPMPQIPNTDFLFN